MPETQLEESDDALEAEESPTEPVPAEFERLNEVLKSKEIESRLEHDIFGWDMRFQLPSGRGSRRVGVIDGPHAMSLAAFPLENHRLLERYVGSWSEAENTIEVRIAGTNWASVGARLRAFPALVESDSVTVSGQILRFVSPDSSIKVQIGPASPLSCALNFARPAYSLTVIGAQVSTTADAERLVERLADSIFLEMAFKMRTRLTLERLRERWAGVGLKMDASLTFPEAEYSHSAAMLYLGGQNAQSSPIVRYWSFYQVLEFFFPKYSAQEARRRAAQMLRHYSFDRFNDSDVGRLVDQISEISRSHSSKEEEQLIATVRGSVTDADLREFIASQELEDVVSKKGASASATLVPLGAGGDIRDSVARRVYDIRCNIVHAKSEHARAGTAGGFIPGSADEDLVLRELPLIRYLAEKALIDSAERLRVGGD